MLSPPQPDFGPNVKSCRRNRLHACHIERTRDISYKGPGDPISFDHVGIVCAVSFPDSSVSKWTTTDLFLGHGVS
jgi:hypothetical protein